VNHAAVPSWSSETPTRTGESVPGRLENGQLEPILGRTVQTTASSLSSVGRVTSTCARTPHACHRTCKAETGQDESTQEVFYYLHRPQGKSVF